MKSILVLNLLLCNAFAAAPTEVQQPPPEAVPEALAAAPEPDKIAVAEAEDSQSPQARLKSCPYGWSAYKTRCYKISTFAMTWHNAEWYCNSRGGHLASVLDPGAHYFLQAITQDAGQSMAWIGGFYLQGSWLWIDGTAFYTSFSPSSYPYTSFSCMNLRSTYLNNAFCHDTQHFICSKDRYECYETHENSF